MVQILNTTDFPTIICKKCDSHLCYNIHTDIKRWRLLYRGREISRGYYIICPKCNNEIQVNKSC